MRLVADGATFAHGFVLIHEGLGLFPMTRGAGLVHPRHRQSTSRFENIESVRVMALYTVHLAFDHGMVLRQIELGMSLQMAGIAHRRVFAWIDNEYAPPAARLNVFAAGTMARFAAAHSRHVGTRIMQSRVRAGWEHASDIGVTLEASLVADERGPWNRRRRYYGMRGC